PVKCALDLRIKLDRAQRVAGFGDQLVLGRPRAAMDATAVIPDVCDAIDGGIDRAKSAQEQRQPKADRPGIDASRQLTAKTVITVVAFAIECPTQRPIPIQPV